MLSSSVELLYEVEPAIVLMEPELMKTVFINVLDNARKSIEGSGQVWLTGKKENEGYVVIIRDSGKGMEQKELDKITDAFYMVDKSRSRKQGGAGLGLAICHEILMLHGFSISFESEVNKGTIVKITMKEQSDE